MKHLVVSLAGIVLLVFLTSAPAADEKLKETPFYPLKVGTKWQYKVGAGSLTIKVTKHEQVGEVTCAVLEKSKDDQVLGSDHIGVTADGVYHYMIAGQKLDMPFRILKLPPKKGDNWKVEVKDRGKSVSGSFTLGEAEVVVPAGKYKAITAVSDGFQLPEADGKTVKIDFKFWFVEKIGLVKHTIQIGDQKEVVIELEKFEGK